MAAAVHFVFHGRLNDFLSPIQAHIPIEFHFQKAPSVKDAMEAIGIPHPEVHSIVANGKMITFDYLLQEDDHIEVYPANENTDWTRQLRSDTKKFVLDVHLGKLAKALRMLGFDAVYENNYNDKEIAAIAEDENRIVLTRDVGLLKHRIIKHGYWLRSQRLNEQLTEVIIHFQLKDQFIPLSRCLVCNTTLQLTAKSKVEEQLPPRTKLYFNEFYLCPNCHRVYWKGSHYDRMEAFIARISGTQF